MAEKPAPKKGNEMVRAVIDLVILCLLLVGAGFGGYYWGIHQRLAPVQSVAPGTPGAISMPVAASNTLPPPKSETANSTTPTTPATPTTDPAPASQPGGTKAASGETSSSPGKHGKTKYWISSSGVDYVGYNITVNVNDQPVDSFFSPGKNVDITRLVKDGDNTISFDAKAMGEQYNKHMGDSKASLILELVAGPYVQENYKKSDVVLSFKRTAVDTEDANESKHFKRE